MKKSNFVALILGTIGIVFFALGMCMALIPEWGMFNQGIVCGVIGLVVLLMLIPLTKGIQIKINHFLLPNRQTEEGFYK